MSAIFGELLTFRQKKGFPVRLRVYGDEFYSRYETPSGFTVVYDHRQGQFCFAKVEKGKFVSSGLPMNQPRPRGLVRHLEESRPVRTQRRRRRYAKIKGVAADGGGSFSPGGLLSGQRLLSGSVHGLTILVDFPWLHAGSSQDDVFELLNGHQPGQAEPSGWPQLSERWSAGQYFQAVSDNKLQYSNDVVGPIRMDHKRGYYIDHLLVEEALTKAMEQYDIDLADYDSQGRGVVDALTFMYAGRTIYADNLWPHNSVEELEFDGIKTHYYAVLSMGRTPDQLTIGTFCHESGHMLCRFPDLYDYGTQDGDVKDSWGLGYYCLMSYGNHLDYGRTPSPVCAYLRDLADWSQRCDLRPVGVKRAIRDNYGQVFHHPTQDPSEYFLVEHRGGPQLDRDLPAQGLAVYHCDTRGSNEWQDGTPERHYQCALVQADDRQDLERYVNGGDEADLYRDRPGLALSVDTSPASRTWQGADSGLDLSLIGAEQTDSAGTSIEFTTAGAGPMRRVTRRSWPEQAIPDHDPVGLSDGLILNNTGRVSSLTLALDISHPRRGDLVIQLQPPEGSAVTLYRGRGGWGSDVQRVFVPATCAALRRLEGRAARGDWTLRVMDGAPLNSGILHGWRLTLQLRPIQG